MAKFRVGQKVRRIDDHSRTEEVMFLYEPLKGFRGKDGRYHGDDLWEPVPLYDVEKARTYLEDQDRLIAIEEAVLDELQSIADTRYRTLLTMKSRRDALTKRLAEETETVDEPTDWFAPPDNEPKFHLVADATDAATAVQVWRTVNGVGTLVGSMTVEVGHDKLVRFEPFGETS